MFEGLDFGAIFTAAGLAKLGQIIVGDLTMAGDNVVIMGSLASGLPARDRPALLVVGLTFSVLLMRFAANYVARVIERHHWLNYIGLCVILWVAFNMIYQGFVGGEHAVGLRHVLRLG